MTQENISSDKKNDDQVTTKNYSIDLSDYLENVKVSFITKFLWWCCGADSMILLKATNYDRVKYAGIGGIVLVCGVLATFSGGLAFNTAFSKKEFGADKMIDSSVVSDGIESYLPFINSIDSLTIATIIFALIWGLMIFNLDRFIISSTGKGDGTDRITWGELGKAAPRLFIASVLALTISKPLEIKIFESEINAELEEEQREYYSDLDEKTNAKFQNELIRLENNREPLLKKDSDIDRILEERRQEIIKLKEELQYEIQGRVAGLKGSGRSGYGPAAKRIEDNISSAETSLQLLRAKFTEEQATIKQELFDIKTQISSINERRSKERLDNEKLAKGLDGLLKRIQISDDISGWIGKILMILLFSLEVGPILFKMMLTKGPYDYMEDNLKHKIMAYNGIVIEGEFYGDGKEGKWVDKKRFIEVESESELAKKRNNDQLEVNQKITEVSKNLALDDVVNNPSKYSSSEES
jgi:hypothetical protein